PSCRRSGSQGRSLCPSRIAHGRARPTARAVGRATRLSLISHSHSAIPAPAPSSRVCEQSCANWLCPAAGKLSQDALEKVSQVLGSPPPAPSTATQHAAARSHTAQVEPFDPVPDGGGLPAPEGGALGPVDGVPVPAGGVSVPAGGVPAP